MRIFPEIDREIPSLVLSKSGIRVEAVLPLSHESSPFLASSVPGKYITDLSGCQVWAVSVRTCRSASVRSFQGARLPLISDHGISVTGKPEGGTVTHFL